jgi:signal transduction histidine kinase
MGLVMVAKDIRERKIMDTKLRHAQKMESVGELAAGIAHEINTPIQFIGDNIQFLQNSYEDLGNILSDGDKLLEALRKGSAYKKLLDKLETSIRDSDLVFLREETPLAITQAQEGVRRVAKIVQAMKQFVHPGQEEKKFININEAIETVLTVSKNEWKYIANMETNFDLGLPLVPCFANEFNQAILNIIVNAAHAIKAKIKKGYNEMGIITISTRSDADRVEIRIKDTGTGIPRNVQPRVFDPFFTTKEVGVGTGQGLHLVHGFIVIHHKGSLSFETETGEGTTFVIHLPLNAD